MKNVSSSNSPHTVASREEWLHARRALLAREKAHTRARDELARERRALPWVRVEKPYRFEGSKGSMSLADLFQGRSQLLVQHIMFGPNWEEACRSCSLMSDHVDGALIHLNQRDVSFAAISRAPYAKLAAFRERMGWTFPWFSSVGGDFCVDFQVSFTAEQLAQDEVDYNFARQAPVLEELPGISAFARDSEGIVHHTYSTYERGCEAAMGVYSWLDMTPKGRDEDGLGFPMAWVRHHDKYDRDYVVDTHSGYVPPRGAVVRGAS